MKNIKPPQFLQNLYRDMRDRRMLLPAVGLVVAILAVPMLLKHKASTASSPSSSSAVARVSDNATIPAVVTQELGATNYRKRLNQLSDKNPFHQLYTRPSKAATAHATSTVTGSTSTTSSTTSVSGTSTDSSTLPTSSGGTSPAPTETSPSASSSPASPPAHSTKPTFHLYTYKVSVQVGEPNELKDRPEVSSLALLPSKHKPILSFLEANGKQALFLVSTDVDSVSGDGRCVPRPGDCQYIVMRPGDKAHFDYAPNGKRYNLVLVDIHAVEIGHKPPRDVSSKSAADLKQKLPLLGDG